MQNKHFFSFLGIPTYGEGGGGSSRLGQIPNFYRKFVLKAPLKVISAGNTWFPRSVAGKGTDRCAADYEAKLRRYDVQFHGVGRGRQGFVILGAWKRVSWWPFSPLPQTPSCFCGVEGGSNEQNKRPTPNV